MGRFKGHLPTPPPPGGPPPLRWVRLSHLVVLLQLTLCVHLRGTGGADTVAAAPLSPSSPSIPGGGQGAASSTPTTTCEPVDIALCKGTVPWNATHLPNLLQHPTQQHAASALEEFRPLLRANCSHLLPLFLCSIYVPPCPGNAQNPLLVSSTPTKVASHQRLASYQQQQQQHRDQRNQRRQRDGGSGACGRALCLLVKRSCDAVVRKLGLSWPDAADCHRLPAASPSSAASVCTASPSLPAAESERLVRHSAHSVINSLPDCKCKKERKLGKKLYMANSFDYAMKGTYLSVQGIKGGPLVIAVRVEQVLKVSRVQIPNNTAELTLWVGKGCVCPRLKPGQQYIFLGYEDADNKRLLFGRKGMAMPWKDAWGRLVAKWEFRLQRKMARERRRQKWKSKIFERRPLPIQDSKTQRRRGRDRSHRTRGRHNRERRLWSGSV